MAHYYDVHGNPRYYMKTKNNTMRPTTIRDAKKFNLVPSFTTIVSVLDKPGILLWEKNQILNAAYAVSKENKSIEQYKEEIFNVVKTNSTGITSRGSQVHDMLENYFLDGSNSNDVIVQSVKKLLDENFGEQSWIAEKSFIHDGYGGKCDLHAKNIVIDFKTKDCAKDRDIKLYHTQCMQLAAYRVGLQMPEAECYNLIVNIQDPSSPFLIKWAEKELQKNYKLFSYLKDYWRCYYDYTI